MQLVTASGMRAIDRATIDGGHVDGGELMERAGLGVFRIILRRFEGELSGRRVVIVCGKGNNGGDGFVIARHLIEAGAEARVFLLSDGHDLSGDAKKALHKLIHIHADPIKLTDSGTGDRLDSSLAEADLVVDALFGTGLAGPLRQAAAGIVEDINRCSAPVLSIDVPSGLSGDADGEAGLCVRADLTATIGLPKLGLYFYPGRAAAGAVETVDIGFPADVIAAQDIRWHLVDRSSARERLPAHDPAGHKYRRGSVLVLAGSRQYGGAALLAVGAALRGGVGMVYAAVPASLAPLVQARWPSAITLPLPENSDGALTFGSLASLAPVLERCSALALGPGLGRDRQTADLVEKLLEQLPIPAVVDADALLPWAGRIADFGNHPAERVLTPHSGELAALLGLPAAEVDSRREETLTAAARTNVFLLHKGAPSIFAPPGGELHVIDGGHPDMARGGTGDLLTGLLGALLAQGDGEVADAALLAAWLHADAGRRAAEALGRGLQSADILDFIAPAWQALEAENPDPEPWK